MKAPGGEKFGKTGEKNRKNQGKFTLIFRFTLTLSTDRPTGHRFALPNGNAKTSDLTAVNVNSEPRSFQILMVVITVVRFHSNIHGSR